MTNIQVPAPIEEKIQKEYPTDTEGIIEYYERQQIPLSAVTDSMIRETARRNHLKRIVARFGYGLAWQWIPVEEPPKQDGSYLCLCGKKVYELTYSLESKAWYCNFAMKSYFEDWTEWVNGWLPLPQPPPQQ